MAAEPTPTTPEYRARILSAIEETARNTREIRGLCQEMAECQHQWFAKMCVRDAQRATAGFELSHHTPTERRRAG